MDFLIQNGIVVNAEGSARTDVLVQNGRIAAMGEGLACANAVRINAEGCFLLPGFIDTHTHFDLDTGSARTADDFVTGGHAAVLGGTTTVLDFATQDRGGTLVQAFDTWQEKARGCSCNYGFHMAIAEWNDKTAAELPEMTRRGVISYKLYMVYDALRVDDGAIYAALKAAKNEGALIGVHCENWDVLNRRIQEVKARGLTGPAGHPLSRPAPVEAEAVARLMRIAELAESPVYVVHLSTAEGLAEARRARARGQEVYLETCPQYLLLTEACYAAEDAAKFVMSPPLRKASDCEALWEALAAGEIDCIGTDHCSFTMAQNCNTGMIFSGSQTAGRAYSIAGSFFTPMAYARGASRRNRWFSSFPPGLRAFSASRTAAQSPPAWPPTSWSGILRMKAALPTQTRRTIPIIRPLPGFLCAAVRGMCF